MRVFVTGATGFVGSAIVEELIGAGHQVLGLTRSEAGASALIAAGAEPHHGDLEDPESLTRGAALADGVIHTAFNHDFSKFAANCDTDAKAIAALGTALIGTDRPLIVTSGIGMLTPGQLATEDMKPRPRSAAIPRVSEQSAWELADKGVHASVVRLPPSVHGAGDHGFVSVLIGIARDKGEAAYIGEGHNRWSAVHRRDAARLFRLALEKGEKGGTYHGVGDSAIELGDIARVIGRNLGVPVVSKSPDEVEGYFGWFSHFAAFDCPASSARTHEQLGWQAVEAGLLADLEDADYFAKA